MELVNAWLVIGSMVITTISLILESRSMRDINRTLKASGG